MDEQETKIREVLEELRSALQNDGGDLEVVAVAGLNVKLRLKGACGCCPHATMTLKNVVERMIKEEVPEVKEIVVG